MAPQHQSGSGSTVATIVGSSVAGFSELALFHPVDTVAKRLMSSQDKFFLPGRPMSESRAILNKVVFKKAAEAPLLGKYQSLFPGLGFAAAYKVLQRVYKFGGQPIVKDFLDRHLDFGAKYGKTMMNAVAGSLVGMGEVVLLPLDVLKIKSQTNPETLKGRGLIELFMKEGRGLYRGTLWTMARNAPGSFALFGGNSFMLDTVFKVENYRNATFFQTFCASTVGAVASIAVASPLDVIKTRIQNRPFDAPESGATILKNLLKQEGVSALFKGLTPKIIVVGPKLIFSFTIAQYLTSAIQKRLA